MPQQSRREMRRNRRRSQAAMAGLVVGIVVVVGLAMAGGLWRFGALPHASASASRAATRAASTTTSPVRPAPATTSGSGVPPETLTAVAPYRGPVPILMYHMIGTPPAGNPNPDLFVRPQEFKAQMRYLAANHYAAVSLQQVWDAWHGRATLPRRPVVVSFDDGYVPDYTIAAPILSAYHWPGVLNLIAGRTPPQLKPWVVHALIHDGWEIDSHTMTHVEVEGLPPAELAFQVGVSRTTLQRMYGVPVDFFCYPSGRYDARAIAAVHAAGYLAAMTTAYGWAQLGEGRYTLSRVRVWRGESLAGFAAELK